MSHPSGISSTTCRRLAAAMLSCVLVALSGCEFDQPLCVRDSDCRDGFACSSSTGYCEPSWDHLDGADTGDDAADADTDQVEEDVEETVEDVRDSQENDEDTPFVPSACVGESSDRGCFTRFEPNDTQLDAKELTASAFGCPYGTNDFRTLDTTKTAGLCGDDTDDYYVLEYVACTSRSFRIDFVITPLASSCPTETYALSAELDGQTYRCGPEQTTSNGDARCAVLSGGRRQLTLYIDQSSRYDDGLVSVHVESTTERGSAFFDYEMRVRLE